MIQINKNKPNLLGYSRKDGTPYLDTSDNLDTSDIWKGFEECYWDWLNPKTGDGNYSKKSSLIEMIKKQANSKSLSNHEKQLLDYFSNEDKLKELLNSNPKDIIKNLRNDDNFNDNIFVHNNFNWDKSIDRLKNIINHANGDDILRKVKSFFELRKLDKEVFQQQLDDYKIPYIKGGSTVEEKVASFTEGRGKVQIIESFCKQEKSKILEKDIKSLIEKICNLHIYSESLNNAFIKKYESFREHNGFNFLKVLGIKTCVYCNANSTLAVGAYTKKAFCQFDHILPKSRFPFLSVSMYNLVPSCANCNQSKSNKEDINIKNPYFSCFHSKIKFNAIFKNSILIPAITNLVKDNDFELKLLPKKGNMKNIIKSYNDMFLLEGVYCHYNDLVADILNKRIVFDDWKRQGLDNFKVRGKSLITENTVKRYILGNYFEEKDFHKRSLSKLTHDIAKQAKIIK